MVRQVLGSRSPLEGSGNPRACSRSPRTWGILVSSSVSHARFRSGRVFAVKFVGIAAALALPLSGLSGSVVASAAEPQPLAQAKMSGTGEKSAPAQQVGSASRSVPATAEEENTDRPPSLRSMYPLIEPDPAEMPTPPQVVEVKSPEVEPEPSFEAKTSQELPQRRDEFSKTFANSDKTETTVFSQAPINYQKPDGSWAPINTKVIEDGAGEGWQVSTTSAPAKIAATADADEVATVEFDESHSVSWGVNGARSVAGQASGSKVVFPQFVPGADLELAVGGRGVKETVVLHSATAPRSYSFPLKLKGLTASLVGSDVLLKDEAGKDRAIIPAGSMQDSSDAVNGPATSTGVTYRLTNEGGQSVLHMDVDGAWLDDPARVYPVRVDPSVLESTIFKSNYAITVGKQGSQLGSSELWLGCRPTSPTAGCDANAQLNASYLSFGVIGRTELKYHRILDAQLSMLNYQAPTCDPRWVSVHGVIEEWQQTDRATIKYPGPDYGPALSGASFAQGFIAQGQTTSQCPFAWKGINLNAAGRAWIQNWVDGKTTNYGLTVRAGNQSDPKAWKKFIGTDSDGNGDPNIGGNPPQLYITHSPYNAKYKVWPLKDPVADAVLQDRAGRIPVTVTNLGPDTWTPSTHYLTYRVFDT